MPSDASWTGSPSVKGSTESTRMALLTFSLIGLQFTWGLEMTYCTPYLLQLGLTKSKTSLVWIAGPLSGLIMQPVVGALSDRSTSRYGRRRPFMIGGSILVGAGLLLLGWTPELVGVFISEEVSRQNITIVVAVLSIYLVDFAVNAVQSCCRSLIVDTLPIPQQQLGAAWASRMTGAGHLIGYLIGTFDVGVVVGRIFGNANNQQFKTMTMIASSALLITVGVTSYSVTERILLLSDATSPKSKANTTSGVLRSLVHRTFNLPPRIQAICWCQFWSWIGWFPFLFYGSTWVGETYYRYEHPTSSTTSSDPKDASHDALGNVGRLGSLALVIFSIITFASSVLLPYIIRSPTSSLSEPGGGKYTPRPSPSLSTAIQSLLLRAGELQPDLVTTWIVSNLIFAGIMVWAPFVHSLAFATLLVALAGVPWAISSWAPFAEMGVEINRLASGQPIGNGRSTNIMFPAGGGRNGYTAVRPSMEAELDEDIEMEEARQHRRALSDSVLRLSHDDKEEVRPSTGELAGVYLGVLNVYTTLPQFVGTFVSWIVFTLLEPSKNDVSDDALDHHNWLSVKKNSPNAIAICLFIGACCSAVAAEATRRLKRLD